MTSKNCSTCAHFSVCILRKLMTDQMEKYAWMLNDRYTMLNKALAPYCTQYLEVKP